VGKNVTQKLIESHLLEGQLVAGSEIAIKMDQALLQDATGTLVMLELEAMHLDRVKTEVAVQYVDHNIIQEDSKNPDDHLFLYSACQRFGIWFSRPGNGVSHPLHQERFSKPGQTLVGSDSHTPAAGSMGMLAIGAGGLEVALALAGEPFYFRMPKVWNVFLSGELREWVSAKDVILEMLRRHGVSGGIGRIIEYSGPGLKCLTAMDRHVIANMGAELGATTSIFPADEAVREFLRAQDREEDWREILADPDAEYDLHERIDLSGLEPLIAMPSSPGNVKRVRDVAGTEIYQAYIGSSANPGYRDMAIVAEMIHGRQIPAHVSLDINPASRQMLENLMRDGHIASLIHAGARLHQAGCNGCIGMGQAPATGKLSLRTVPRNFPGRSGTPEDKVCLVSPETAAASALRGEITDPRTLDIPYVKIVEPKQTAINMMMFVPPLELEAAQKVELQKGPNIASLPEFSELPDEMLLPTLLKVCDDISTDEIMPAGARVLPYRSNIPKISAFAFEKVDPSYAERARQQCVTRGHVIIGGRNYGQGSSREHAALAPRYLGLLVVIAKSFARIHRQNLANFGVLPLTLEDESEYDRLQAHDELRFSRLRQTLRSGGPLVVENLTSEREFRTAYDLSPREIEVILAGGLTNFIRNRQLALAHA
jgi:aconitate hydratase